MRDPMLEAAPQVAVSGGWGAPERHRGDFGAAIREAVTYTLQVTAPLLHPSSDAWPRRASA
jgi:hypothetical protein